MIQSLFFSVVAFGIAMVIFKIADIDAGEAGGIIAGALTQSATIGTATSAINGLAISAAAKSAMTSNVAIAYAVTYVFGTMGVVIFLKNIAPAILRVNLKDETKIMMESLNLDTSDSSSPLLSTLATRSFEILQLPKEKMTVAAFEKKFHDKIVLQQLFSQRKPVDFDAQTLLKKRTGSHRSRRQRGSMEAHQRGRQLQRSLRRCVS